ncbi:MAG: glycosyltransferase [Rhodomicrobium sp.]|nr:glycosyltransferase [Rhodomicrobium sp.]
MDLLTIHLNDYFQCGASGCVVPRRYWGRFQSRTESNTLELLNLLDRNDCRATFYSSGWVADKFPALLTEIADRGHEIASTGYYQYPVLGLSRDEFRTEAVRSRLSLERACGREVVGYRCAGWLRSSEHWALEILASEGFKYDSSVLYLGLDIFGKKIETAKEYQFGANSIWEIPVPTGAVLGFRFPISGGTYLRQLPRDLIGGQIDRWHRQSKTPWLLYFQVAELDPDQPRISALPWLRKLQKYRNIEEMQRRVRGYLETFSFSSISEHLGIAIGAAALSEPAREDATDIRLDSEARTKRPITIVVPCYQEEDVVGYLANALTAFEVEHGRDYEISYVFVDDGSDDATYAKLLEVFGEKANAAILRHAQNRGVAAAMLTGIRHAPTETVCVIDCDCSYDPEHLAKMAPLLGDDVAMVTASPYHREGSVVNVPGWRLFLSRGLSALYQQLLNTQLATYTSCCRVYRKSAVVNLELENNGFLGVLEIVVRLDERGEKILEAPAVLEARVLGASKMKTIRTIFAHLRAIGSLVARRLRAGSALRRTQRIIVQPTDAEPIG